MDTNILLESGTNELEILEFMVGGNYYGINVAKIREIITCQELTPIPNSHPNVEGAFSTRGETITVVNLARALGMKEQMDVECRLWKQEAEQEVEAQRKELSERLGHFYELHRGLKELLEEPSETVRETEGGTTA